MAAAAAAEMIMMIETSLARSWRGCNCQSESQHRFLHPGVHGFRPRQDHVARVGVINGDSTNAVGMGTFASTGASPNEARAKSSRVQCCLLPICDKSLPQPIAVISPHLRCLWRTSLPLGKECTVLRPPVPYLISFLGCIVSGEMRLQPQPQRD